MIFSAEEAEQLQKCFECEEDCKLMKPCNRPIVTAFDSNGNERFREWMHELLTEPLPCRREQKK